MSQQLIILGQLNRTSQNQSISAQTLETLPKK